MKTTLIHACNNRTYTPLIQNLSKKIDSTLLSLHNNIFDLYHKIQPKTVILPIYEYTQEFHDFVDAFKDKINIILFMGEIEHQDLTTYCTNFKIKTIRRTTDSCSNSLGYEHLYDSTIFINNNLIKNDKILTILHSDSDINHKLLDPILYPKTQTKIVLINNPEFKHPQNIGVANSFDMAILLNQFGSLLDISGAYNIEAQACGIRNISIENDIINNIQQNILVPKIHNIEKYSITNFVNNQLLKFIEA